MLCRNAVCVLGILIELPRAGVPDAVGAVAFCFEAMSARAFKIWEVSVTGAAAFDCFCWPSAMKSCGGVPPGVEDCIAT